MLGVVGDLISKVCGKRSGLVMRERIFEPLGMIRSFTRNDEYPDDENCAEGYYIFSDGSVCPRGPSALEDGSLQGASGYVRSTVRDMLMWAKAYMDAEKFEGLFRSDRGDKSPNRLRGITFSRSAHRPIMPGKEGYENSYGLGWFRHMLPSRCLSAIGPNSPLLPDPPVVDRDGPPRLAVAHWGSFQSFVSAFYTFPLTCSAVIVMTNGDCSRCDPTDLIAQAIIQDLFDMQPRIKLEEYALQAAHTSSLLWGDLVESWIANRVQATLMGDLNEYVGTYVNDGLCMTIHVLKVAEAHVKPGPSPELLSFKVNSQPRQTAQLRHYHYDTWTFLPDNYDDALRKGMKGFLKLSMLLLSFGRNKDGKITRLEWDLQGNHCEGTPNLDNRVPSVHFTKHVD